MRNKFDRLGETKVMLCGLKATIIRYGGYNDVDIRFEDNSIVKNIYYKRFSNGTAKPLRLRHKKPVNDRTGEEKVMSCGLKAKIIAYRNCCDMDVIFEDGQIRKGVKYSCFSHGYIAPEIDPRVVVEQQSRLGMERKMNCGLVAKIIAYRSSTDIDVQFSDGSINKNKLYSSFLKGEIAPKKCNRVGEKRIMNCGLEGEIIRYGTSEDIDVRFPNGSVAKGKTYGAFSKGRIKPPINPYVGERRTMNCGLECEIVRYVGCRNIDVRFSNGVVVNSNLAKFKNGKITPDYAEITHREGLIVQTNYGLRVKIVRYSSSTDIDICFEDGAVINNTRYDGISKGSVLHPSMLRGLYSRDFHGYKIKFAYKLGDLVYYFCEKSGERSIMTLQEMVIASGGKLVF